MESKTDAALPILQLIPATQRQNVAEYLDVQSLDKSGNWEIVVKYNGDIQEVAQKEGGAAQIINSQFAVLSIPEDRVNHLLSYTQVEYMETPKRLFYTPMQGVEESCITSVQNRSPYYLKGEGTLLGIIDSGINYFHPDFRNEDGSTRITSIWDQSINGNPPSGFLMGSQYTREQINRALQAPNRAAALEIVPSQDFEGHGTHVAGIAGGNGRASNGELVGVAPKAEFIIVKLGRADQEGFATSVQIMLAVKYVIEQALALQKPVAINISLGMNIGPHDGNALIEQYLDMAATLWKTNIIVGSGNEGQARSHTSGQVQMGNTSYFEFQVGPGIFYYTLSIWQNPVDTLAFQVISPSGRRTDFIYYAAGPQQFGLAATKLYTAFAGPSPLSGDVEFALFLTGGTSSGLVDEGVWRVVIKGVNVVDGKYNVWGPTSQSAGSYTFFLEPTVETTLTTPSTSRLVTTVGAYNSQTGQIAPFSGRGFGRNRLVIKPDLVAPGVEIQSVSHLNNGYRVLSGTSMAAPFVTGASALLMQWGIVKGNNPFLYGENLKTYLLKGAHRDIEGVTFPSPIWGYGKLCVKDSLDLLRLMQVF